MINLYQLSHLQIFFGLTHPNDFVAFFYSILNSYVLSKSIGVARASKRFSHRVWEHCANEIRTIRIGERITEIVPQSFTPFLNLEVADFP